MIDFKSQLRKGSNRMTDLTNLCLTVEYFDNYLSVEVLIIICHLVMIK